MMTTLAERLKQAMEGPPKVTAAAIARACKITRPSVHAWLSGRTKTIEGANLLAAAKLLQVTPEWLTSGNGLMRPHPSGVSEPSAGYGDDKLLNEAIELLRKVPASQLPETINFLRWQLANKAPPTDGPALSVAA
jgi:transcriptional regulator with XRE-family HTH domain